VTRLVAGKSLAVLTLLLAATSVAAAQSLDITGPYGNADGCKFAKEGLAVSEDMLLLTPNEIRSYGTGCEFVEVLTAKDGSKVVTGICGYEGEDGIGTQSFVIGKGRKDVTGFVIYNSDGSVFGEVAPCP
jgi:hypothetical protein